MRSIFPVSEKPSTWRPLCSSGAERSEPNATSNLRGTSAERRLGLLADEVLEIAPEALLELAPLEVAELDPDAAVDRLREALAEEGERVVEPFRRRRAPTPSSFGSPEKNLNSVWCAIEPRSRASTSPSIERGSISRSRNQIDEQSAKSSSSVTEKLAFSRSAVDSAWSVRRVGREKAPSARVEPPIPAVRVRERERPRPELSAASELRARSRSRSVGAESTSQVSCASRRRVVQRSTSAGVEECARLVPERARLPRRALVGRGLADEVEAPRRPRARRVEEEALARDLVGLREPRALRGLVDRAALLLVEERRALLAAGEAPLLEAEQEDDLGAASPGAEEIRDRDSAGLVTAGEPHRGAVERAVELVPGERAAELEPGLQLGDEVRDGTVRPEVERGVFPDRRRLEPVGRADHRAGEPADGLERLGRRPGTSRASRSGCPRSFSVSSTTRAGSLTARPRRLPSR